MNADDKKYNNDYDWNYNPTTYVEGNYRILIPEDHRLSRVTIGALRERATIGSLKRAIHIGIGAVPRGSALIAPFMDTPENGARIIMADIGEIKLQDTRKLMNELRAGDLGLWQIHEDSMSDVDLLWKNSFKTAGHLSHVTELNMFDLEENSYDIGTAEFVFESATKMKSEWRRSLRKYMRSIKPGGFVHVAYINGSEGYNADGIEYPAYPVTNDGVLKCAEEELIDIEQYFTSASGQMREEGDTHAYKGLGVIIGTRRTA